MPNDSDSQIRRPRPRLPFPYLFAALAAVLVLPILVWVLWGWIEAARLDRVLDALEARHEPLDIAEFNVRPTTPEQREASHLYAQAGKLVDDRSISMQHAAALSKTIETVCSPEVEPSVRIAQTRVLLEFEESYQPVFDLLEQASQLDASGWDDGDEPARQSMQQVRPITLARANVVRIARLACTGDGDGAARALLASLRLRRVWTGAQIGPIAQQTSHGLQSVLTLSTPSPALLEQVQHEYIAVADETRFQRWIARERAAWLSYALPGAFGDPPPGYTEQKTSPVEGVATRALRPLRDHRLVEELNEFDDALAIAKQAWPGKLDAIAAFVTTRPPGRSQSIRRGLVDTLSRPLGAHMASSALGGYIGGMTETLARNRASAAAIALARYRRDHADACPDTLQQLVPQYLAAPLIDPYSGAELKHQCDGTGFKVYSVGANRKDDGGRWEQHSDLQLSRRGNPPDIGIAVKRSSTRTPD
jgi:hypothetical protein